MKITQAQKHKQHIRSRDRKWFGIRLPKSFRIGKNIHHDWAHGECCYWLEIDIHKVLHGISNR